MHPKVVIRKQREAAEATVKALVEMRLAIERLERKVDKLIGEAKRDNSDKG